MKPRYPGLATAAAPAPLLTCPVCHIPNFSERGLAGHCCRAKPNRERLTPSEIAEAKRRAGAGSLAKPAA